jgi:hypothetical protein
MCRCVGDFRDDWQQIESYVEQLSEQLKEYRTSSGMNSLASPIDNYLFERLEIPRSLSINIPNTLPSAGNNNNNNKHKNFGKKRKLWVCKLEGGKFVLISHSF